MAYMVEFEKQPEDREADPLDESPLAERLHALRWPTPPPDVKERCLEAILAEVDPAQRRAHGR